MTITTRQINVLLTALVLSGFVVSDDIIGKFQKLQCKVHDPVTIQNLRCWSKPVNRSFTFTNAEANITQALNNVLIKVNFGLFKKAGINYRPFLVNVTEDYCAFFAKNQASVYLRIFGSIYLPYTNLNHTCPYRGYAYIKDMPLSIGKVLSIWPPGEFRMDVTCFEYQRRLITLEYFLEIKEKRKVSGRVT